MSSVLSCATFQIGNSTVWEPQATHPGQLLSEDNHRILLLTVYFFEFPPALAKLSGIPWYPTALPFSLSLTHPSTLLL